MIFVIKVANNNLKKIHIRNIEYLQLKTMTASIMFPTNCLNTPITVRIQKTKVSNCWSELELFH